MVEALEVVAGFEVLIDAISAASGLSVLLLARRLASRLSLFLHRRALRIFLLGAACFVLSECIAVLEALAGVAWPVTVVVEDVAELSMLVCLGVAVYVIFKSEREEISVLRRSANTDELTNLSNRHFFRRAAMRRLELSLKNALPLSCVVLDIDDFKDYNDRFGHEMGDGALRCVADALKKSARADDLVARYGGEEFVLLMNVTLSEATTVAERIRETVESRCSPDRDPSLLRGITVSLGVSTPDGGTRALEDLISAADREMYHAKRSGKNRVYPIV